MLGSNQDEAMIGDPALEACEVCEKSPLRKSKGSHVHYGTIHDAEHESTAAKEMSTQLNTFSSLPVQPRNSFHAFFLNECLLILSSTLAFGVLVFEISVIIGYGDETLRESRYLWAVNWFLVAWIGLQFCVLSVHHWDCWIKDERCGPVKQGVEEMV